MGADKFFLVVNELWRVGRGNMCEWMGTIEIAAKKEVFGCCWTLMRLMIAEYFK